jgi:hypothetical protein
MRCRKCGAEIDELNESQPVCPACGAPPGVGDDADVAAVLGDAGLLATLAPEGEQPDIGATESGDDLTAMPPDLQAALDDAEALLLATGNAGFTVPGKGFRVFPLPTDRVM